MYGFFAKNEMNLHLFVFSPLENVELPFFRLRSSLPVRSFLCNEFYLHAYYILIFWITEDLKAFDGFQQIKKSSYSIEPETRMGSCCPRNIFLSNNPGNIWNANLQSNKRRFWNQNSFHKMWIKGYFASKWESLKCRPIFLPDWTSYITEPWDIQGTV